MSKRRRNVRLCALASTLVLAGIAQTAHAVYAINLPWVRVAENATSAEAYMELQSSDGAALVAVRSDAAASITIRRPGKGIATVRSCRCPRGCR